MIGLMARGQQNYASYRAEFGSTEPPHLPFLGVHLSDLVALDQLPTWLDGPGASNSVQFVNFKKMRKLEQVMAALFGCLGSLPQGCVLTKQAARPMLSCRYYPYATLETSWPVHKFLTQDLVVLSIQQLTEQSRLCEPSKTS